MSQCWICGAQANSGEHIIKRTDNKEKGINASEQMRYQINNSTYLANLIFQTIKPYLNKNTIIGFEGISYGSSGNIVL